MMRMCYSSRMAASAYKLRKSYTRNPSSRHALASSAAMNQLQFLLIQRRRWKLRHLCVATMKCFQRIVQMSSRYQEEYGSITKTMLDEPGRLADYIAAVLDLKAHDKQRILESVSIHERLNTLAVILAKRT